MFGDVFADEFWAARSDVPELRASEGGRFLSKRPRSLRSTHIPRWSD
jgi:hypothetical protein